METTPTTPDRIRLTITVTPEVHAAFSRLAEASGMSLGRAMGEWLGDTLDAVEFTATKVEQARAAPRLAMREMHAYAMGLADEAGALLEKVRKEGAAGRRQAQRADPLHPSPPSSNTGGKVPGKTVRRGGKS